MGTLLQLLLVVVNVCNAMPKSIERGKMRLCQKEGASWTVWAGSHTAICQQRCAFRGFLSEHWCSNEQWGQWRWCCSVSWLSYALKVSAQPLHGSSNQDWNVGQVWMQGVWTTRQQKSTYIHMSTKVCSRTYMINMLGLKIIKSKLHKSHFSCRPRQSAD